jgi:hypothetical protein
MRKLKREKEITAIRASMSGRFRDQMVPIFIMYGAKLEEFKTESDTSDISGKALIRTFRTRIVKTTKTIICLIGSNKKSPLLKLVGKDIVLQLARNIYQTRCDKAWDQAVP